MPTKATPLYLVYAPGTPGEPEVLPELLTANDVLQALQKASCKARKPADGCV